MHNKEVHKAKNFKEAIKRLVKELKGYQILILLALMLACFSSVMSIICPKQLSKITDEITLGIKLDNESLEKIITQSQTNYLSGNFTNFKVKGVNITVEDQNKLLNLYSNINPNNQDEMLKLIDKMPKNIQKVVTPKMNMVRVKNLIFLLFSFYFISAIFSYFEAILMANISNKFAMNLRKKINKKINKLPLSYFDRNMHGDILSRITNDVDTLCQSMNQSLSSLVSSVTLLIGTMVMMFVTNVTLAFVALISSVFGFLFMALVLKKSQKYFERRQKELGQLNGHIEEVYSGLKVIKAYNGEKEATLTFDKYNDSVRDANFKSQFFSELMHPMMEFIGNFGYLAVCVVGALLTMNNTITFGVIIAFITYVRLFTSPLREMSQAMTNVQSIAASSERVFEILDETEMNDDTDKKKYLDKDLVKGNIEFKNVSFTYDLNKEPTIKNFSAKCKSGNKIAIVGPTGAGKTTMVNLLMKFYELGGGDILIDGVSIKELSKQNIHELFTMVLQDTWLFEGTIMENLKYNRTNLYESDIKKVCEIVGVDHFIKTLSNGYDTLITEADNISSGQRQLLTIARAMLSDTPFLILDEATSNVDTRTEELVQDAMDKLATGKTSFIIAHRLSTIKNADLILVMNHGNIIETGTHTELLNKKGFYSELYNSQFNLK